MSNSRMILFVISIVACLIVPKTCNAQSPNIDENTGCPLNVDHVCRYCAYDQNHYGCYCVDDEITTASLSTPCPTDIVDPCVNNTCQNSATCVRDGLTSYRCNCTAGFGGAFCNETLPKCADPGIECPNAECIDTNDWTLPVYCQCYDGSRRNPTKNETCPISPCYEKDTEKPVCQNNGTCRIVNNAPLCQCTGGYAGQNCTKTLKTPLCESQPGVCGEGICQQSLSPPHYSCNCGAHPSTFAAELNKLTKCEEGGCYAVNPCLNGGTCSNKGVGAFVCQCTPRFTGSKCEKQSACYNNPCQNKGVCQSFNETAYFCDCPPYFTGKNCEIVVPNPCVTKNCGPYGECHDVQGLGVCRCNDGLHHDGSACQNPCANYSCGKGICTPKSNATYEATCSCPVNVTGDHCEVSRDVCRKNPPCGGGYCKPNYSAKNYYSCVCEGGVVKNEPCPFSKNCPITNCGTQGICVQTDGIIVKPGNLPINYVCSCEKGYIAYSDCNGVLSKVATAAITDICGPNGKPYPSRNPGNPIGCWCNNGTHIEEIDENGPTDLCV